MHFAQNLVTSSLKRLKKAPKIIDQAQQDADVTQLLYPHGPHEESLKRTVIGGTRDAKKFGYFDVVFGLVPYLGEKGIGLKSIVQIRAGLMERVNGELKEPLSIIRLEDSNPLRPGKNESLLTIRLKEPFNQNALKTLQNGSPMIEKYVLNGVEQDVTKPVSLKPLIDLQKKICW
jgi:hypothetical protein